MRVGVGVGKNVGNDGIGVGTDDGFGEDVGETVGGRPRHISI